MENYLLISDAAKEVKVESHVLRYWEEELHLPIKRNELGHRYYTREDVERFKQIKSMKERGLQLKAIKMILKDGKIDVMLPEEEKEALKRHNVVQGKEASEQQSNSQTPEKKGAGPQNNSQVLEKRGASPQNNSQVPEKRGASPQNGGQVPEKNISVGKPIKEADSVSEEHEKAIVWDNKRGHYFREQEGMAIDIVDNKNTQVVQESKEEKARRLQWLLQQLIRETLQENNKELCREIKESVIKELDYQFRVRDEREEERERIQNQRNEEYYQKMDELLRKKTRIRRTSVNRRKKDLEEEKARVGKEKSKQSDIDFYALSEKEPKDIQEKEKEKEKGKSKNKRHSIF